MTGGIQKRKIMVSKEEIDVLKLTKNEVSVLGVVNFVPQKLVDIVQTSQLPHTTVYETLHSLRIRGLLLSTGEGRARRWLKLRQSPVRHDIKPHGKKDVQIFQGRETTLSLVSELFITHKGDRLLSFHGEKTLEGWLSLLNKEEIEKRNIMIIENKIIVERYVPEKGYKKVFKSFPESWHKTMVGRTHITYLLPDELFDSKTELLMFSDVAVVYETHLQRMTVFRDKETVVLYTSFFEMMRRLGRKVNSEEVFRKYQEASESS